jgi:hypothetical protein
VDEAGTFRHVAGSFAGQVLEAADGSAVMGSPKKSK